MDTIIVNKLEELLALRDANGGGLIKSQMMWLYNEAPQDMLHNPNYSGIIARVDEPPKSESL